MPTSAAMLSPRHPYTCTFMPAGEWFEAKAQPGEHLEPLDEQRAVVVANLWCVGSGDQQWRLQSCAAPAGAVRTAGRQVLRSAARSAGHLLKQTRATLLAC